MMKLGLYFALFLMLIPFTFAIGENHLVKTPVWAKDDSWFYETDIYVKGELPSEYRVKAIDGTWNVDNATTKVINVSESTYTVEVYGNLTGSLTLYVKAVNVELQQLDSGEKPLTVDVRGTYQSKNSIRREDLATISTSVIVHGKFYSIKVLPFYIKLNISYNPPSTMLRFPFKVGDSWEVETKVTIDGEMYVQEWMDPPKKIHEERVARESFTCVGKDRVKTKAGFFDAYHIVGSSGGDLWYSEKVTNVIKGVVQQFSIGNATFTVYMDLIWYDIKLPPSINIIRPEQGYLYFFDKKLFKLGGNTTIAIGPITISTHVENESPVDRVEFYLNDNLSYVASREPFEWKCREHYVGDAVFRCLAYDVYGKYGEDWIKIYFINFL